MYQLKVNDELFFKPNVENLALSEVKVNNIELNSSGELKFTIPPTNDWYSRIEELTTYIDLYSNNEWLWGFRIVQIEQDFSKNKIVTCEGYLSFLVDSIMRPFEYTGGVNGMFTKIIENHNSQVEEEKQFTIGTINVVDPNDYVNRSSGNYLNSLELIKTRLIETLGGYLRIRKENGIKYIDYITDYQSVNTQVIRFGENLLDLNNYIDASTVKTAIIPLGADLDEEEGINGVAPKLTIESVNGGLDYIVHDEAVKIFGYIWGTVNFDDVELPENLLTKSKTELNNIVYSDMSIEINAVDLSKIDVNTEEFRLGDWVTIVSKPHGLEKQMLLSSISLDLNSVDNDVYVLGSTIKEFASSTANRNKEISQQAENTANYQFSFLNNAIQNATDLITGGKGGYVVFQYSDSGIFEEICILDTPSIETATNVWRWNKNGFGFSSTGYNGTYGTAITMDGAIVADYITAGTLNGITINQFASNGEKSVTIDKNKVEIYSWEDGGNYVGSLGSTVNQGTGRQNISLWADWGDRVTIGAFKDATDTSVTPAIVIDSTTITTATPWVRNTVSGTLFSGNPNGGIVVENGFIKTWSLTGFSGQVAVSSNLILTFNNGLLTGIANS